MEVVELQVYLRQFIVRDNGTLRIGLRVQLTANFESSFGGRCGNQLDDDFVADKRFAAPVLADEREQPMLDLVPFAGARRQVAHGNRQAEFIGQFLQFQFPQPQARAIAAAAIGRDQQLPGVGVEGLAHQAPPATNALDRKGRRVVIDPDIDPAHIVRDIVDAIGSRLAQLRVTKS